VQEIKKNELGVKMILRLIHPGKKLKMMTNQNLQDLNVRNPRD
jgi:hypothetical protein